MVAPVLWKKLWILEQKIERFGLPFLQEKPCGG